MKQWIVFFVAWFCANPLQAETQAVKWNRFAEEVYQLHLSRDALFCG